MENVSLEKAWEMVEHHQWLYNGCLACSKHYDARTKEGKIKKQSYVSEARYHKRQIRKYTRMGRILEAQ